MYKLDSLNYTRHINRTGIHIVLTVPAIRGNTPMYKCVHYNITQVQCTLRKLLFVLPFLSCWQ